MQHLPSKIPPESFQKGDKIEARRAGDAVTWHPATFIRLCGDRAYVKFETSSDNNDPTSPLRREYVSAADVRPPQPSELHRYFKVGEIAEGFCGERKGWRRARIVGILENSRYSVVFEGAEAEAEGEGLASAVEQWELRAVREWIDGSWYPPLLLQQAPPVKSSCEAQTLSNGLKLKIKCKARKPQVTKFREGMLVEVTSYEQGFEGSWFVAVIVKPLENEKYLVEYRTLRTPDQTDYLREEAHASCIRCIPPVINRVKPFELLERVDAYANSGWWEGHVVQVLNGSLYMVHFPYTNEDIVLEHCILRPHQECIDGQWFSDLKVDMTTEVNVKPKRLKIKNSRTAEAIVFREGMMVEVKSDEEGYHGSWFTAEIVGPLGSEEFLVEYQTLKTDDESALLREKALASYIRPCPPEIMRIDCYKVLEEVDAWYNDGWWVGLVSKVLDNRRYGVYFWTTNEEIFFKHTDLRDHQNWIGGKWTASMKKKSELQVNNRRVIYIGEHDGIGVEPYFVDGMKVEIKGDDGDSNEGIWYPALIVKSLGVRNYLVQYQTLKNEYGTQLHQEAFAPCMRPSPLVLQRRDPFKPFDKVDAWHNNGWCVGRVHKASRSRNYSVCFDATNEILEFQHFELRPHQDWIHGQWVLAIRGS